MGEILVWGRHFNVLETAIRTGDSSDSLRNPICRREPRVLGLAKYFGESPEYCIVA
jgi:hypothetical protein